MLIFVNAFSVNMLSDPKNQVTFDKVPPDHVQDLVDSYLRMKSFIGHKETSDILSEMFNADIPQNRISYKMQASDVVILAQYTGPRLAEGATTLPPGAKIEFWRVKLNRSVGNFVDGDHSYTIIG